MLNPYVLLALLIGWGASITGAFVYGGNVREDHIRAEDSRTADAILEARNQAQLGAADAISQLRITNTTIHQEVQREIRTNTVYADCKLPAGGLRIANEALTGQRPAVPASGGQLPRADANGGRR